MDIETLVSILDSVPETKLKLLDLAAELLDASGNLRQDAAQVLGLEIEGAASEAEVYVRGTKEMVRQLRWLIDTRDR